MQIKIKNFKKEKLLFYFVSALTAAGCVINAIDAWKITIWWNETYSQNESVPKLMGHFFRNFIGNWVVIDGISAIFTLSALVFIGFLIKKIFHHVTLKKYTQEEDRKRITEKTSKVLFLLSFLPLVVIFIAGCISMVSGRQAGLLGGPTIYGAEAFLDAVVWWGLGMIIVPILPAALIFQIIYLVKQWKGKHSSRENKNIEE